jgi:hypothetical protein
MAKLCADFSNPTVFPDNHPFPPAPSNFVLAGFTFKQVGGTDPLFVNRTAAEQGLQFTPKGLRVTLPCPKTRVELRLGTFAGAVDISMYDTSGNLINTRNIAGTNTYQNIVLQTRKRMARIVLTKGGFEAILVRICINYRCN